MARPQSSHARASSAAADFLEAIEAAYDTTPGAQRVHRRILALQRRLKPKLDDSGWRTYLALEEALNDRQLGLLDYLQRHFTVRRRRRAQRQSPVRPSRTP